MATGLIPTRVKFATWGRSELTSDSLAVRIVGPGRAGRSFAHAWSCAGVAVELLDRHAEVTEAAADVDAVLIAVPDAAIAEVATSIAPGAAAVLHCSGATGLAPVAHHNRHGSIHPLMALPNPEVGAARLADRGWFAVAGDPVAVSLVEVLGGRFFEVPDDKRAIYHAAAAVSANHLVALLGQVERLAELADVPVEAFLELAQGSMQDVADLGAAAALTGPAARRDHATLDAHRHALPADEVDLYNALVAAAQRLTPPS